MKVLDLFSGIGGFSLGLEAAGFETVAFCEYEPYCQKVLTKNWPEVPIHDDIRQLDGRAYRGTVGLVCGGYPCQPFSTAGKRAGTEDDRHLWPEMFRIIKESRPAWVLCENVAGHINMGLDDVLSDLESEGYACQPLVIPAVAVDAPQRRDRVWILASNAKYDRSTEQERQHERPQKPCGSSKDGLEAGHDVAYSDSYRIRDEQKPELRGGDTAKPSTNGTSQPLANSKSGNDGSSVTGAVQRQKQEPGNSSQQDNVADSDSDSGERLKPCQPTEEGRAGQISGQAGPCGDGFRWWPAEPPVGRVANGVPNRSHRIKALGNAVVPQVVEMIGRAIMEAHNANF